MAKNYLYTHTILGDRRGEILPMILYKNVHVRHHRYVDSYLKPAVIAAKCGWDDLKYHCVKYPGSDHIYPYMVLYVGEKPERWIPVEGNSMGCNLQVIGENLW